MSTQRLFIAIPLPPPVRSVLTGLISPLRHVRWLPEEQLHLTVRFLGDTEVELVESLIGRLQAIQVEPFLLPVEGVGAFPPKAPPRVLWAGLGSGHPRLHQLRQRLDDAVLATGLEADLRSFHPHITLGRCQEGASTAVAGWLRQHREFAGPSFRVDSFQLFASDLHSWGAVHRPLAEFPLGRSGGSATP